MSFVLWANAANQQFSTQCGLSFDTIWPKTCVEGTCVVGDVGGVALADFVDALRDQIKTAQQSADPELPIEVGPITLEFTLTTRREGEGRAGVKFWVVDSGVSGKLGRESTQKVTMQLIPRSPDGQGPARVRDQEAPERRSGDPVRDLEPG
jgi:hypothetical protein